MEIVSDGTLDFVGGQDASKIPDSVPENAVYQAINVTNKRGCVAPRWGFEKQTLTFDKGVVTDSVRRSFDYKYYFESGKFQARVPYLIGSTRYVLIVVSGRIFLYNQHTNFISYIEITDKSTLNPRASRINWALAGEHVILFDYPAYPVIIEGITARRADPTKQEIPVSSIGCYNQNRLFIGNIGDEFTAGDAVGNTAAPDAPITFKELLTSGSPYYGQIFKLPTHLTADPITAMGFLQLNDTSTGIGPLLIGTDTGIYSYSTQNPRDEWTGTSGYGSGGQFGSVLVQGNGIVGQRAFDNVGQDIFFMSLDGHVRTLNMSRTQQQRYARVPISREVEPWLKYFDKNLSRFNFVTAYNNKVFFSANPYRQAAIDFHSGGAISDYAFGGLVVLEFDNVVSMGEASNPTWAGLWTGVRPMDMVVSGDDSFIIAKDGGINSIYKVNPDLTYDTADGKIRQIRSRIYTREFNFKNPFQNKEVHSIDFNIDEIKGDFKICVDYKPSHAHGYHFWRSFTHTVPWRDCGIPDSCLLNGYAHQYIREFNLGSPDVNECDAITGEAYTLFRKILLRITITGINWELHELNVNAIPRARNLTESLCEDYEYPVIPYPEDCGDDWVIPEFSTCQTLQT